MLQQMRKFAKSWVASVFLGVLALSFGVWGIADIFTSTVDTTAATIGDVKISQAEFQREYQNLVRNQSATLGTQITPEQAQAMGLGQDTLERIISRTAVDTEVQRLGLTATDATVAEQIRAIPAFAGPTGSFDHNTFLRAIDRSGFTEQVFIEAVRSDTARTQLLDATKNGLQAPPGYVRALFNYLNEMRAVHYVVVPPAAAGDVPKPTDAQLESYMGAHPDRFSTPEYREFTYAGIAPEDLANEVSVTDKNLQNEYELRQDQYRTPEKREVEQITFPDEKAAATASAQIEQGTSFEAIATARGLKPSDTRLGELQEADLGPERGKAAFALSEGGVSKPVKGTFGYVLLKVSKIVPGQSKTFDDVKEALRKDVLTKLAQSKIGDMVNAFEDAMAGGDTLAEAAKKVGMKVVHVKAMDKAGLAADGNKADIPAKPEFVAQVFSADIGVIGDPFQTQDGSAYALKVDGDTPPKLKPLAEVRPQVEAEWTDAKRRTALLDKATALAAQATRDGSLAAIATAVNAKEEESGGLQRGRANETFSSDLVAKIFEAAPGTAVFGKSAKGGDFIVARITGIIHPPPLTTGDPQYRQFVDQISEQIGSDIPTAFAMAARKRQGVSVNQKIVNGVTGAGS